MATPTPKPVLFQRPNNWDSMSRGEREQFVDDILDLLGVPEDDGSK